MENILLEYVENLFNEEKLILFVLLHLKIFARAKAGATNESVEEEEAMEEEQADDQQKQLYDENPIDDGWKVSGTIKNSQGYKRSAFIQEIVQVEKFDLFFVDKKKRFLLV